MSTSKRRDLLSVSMTEKRDREMTDAETEAAAVVLEVREAATAKAGPSEDRERREETTRTITEKREETTEEMRILSSEAEAEAEEVEGKTTEARTDPK